MRFVAETPSIDIAPNVVLRVRPEGEAGRRPEGWSAFVALWHVSASSMQATSGRGP